ncbi:MAG: phage tail protein [Kiritimatiellae bacterium]|nr:phage tail protein [Kiritimatiellia bacterium]
MADSKVKFGLSKVHVAFLENGTYGTPIAVPGAVHLTTDPDVGDYTFWADNKKYFVYKKKNGYTGSLEVALFPEAVRAKMLGDYIDYHGNYVEDAEGKACPFALLAQIEGDDEARRVIWYETVASTPGSDDSTSEENPEVSTESADITIVPHTFSAITKDIVKMVCHEGDTDYENFFTAVVTPGAPTTTTTGA